MFGSISKVKAVLAVVLLATTITLAFKGAGSFAEAMNISSVLAMVGAGVASGLCVLWTGYMLVTENERESKGSK